MSGVIGSGEAKSGVGRAAGGFGTELSGQEVPKQGEVELLTRAAPVVVWLWM